MNNGPRNDQNDSVDAHRQWLAHNDNFLGAALDWLKLRLLLQAEVVSPPTAEPSRSAPWKPSRDATRATTKDLHHAAQAMATALEVSPPPALALLGELFELTVFEQQVLLLCAAMELDTQIAPLCAQAQDAS
ncbi:MAG: hypothetical protein WBA10_18415, partial [Elainellaceae cyanobacterium]